MKKSKVKIITIEVETSANNKDLGAHARQRVAKVGSPDSPTFVEVRQVKVVEAQPAVRR